LGFGAWGCRHSLFLSFYFTKVLMLTDFLMSFVFYNIHYLDLP